MLRRTSRVSKQTGDLVHFPRRTSRGRWIQGLLPREARDLLADPVASFPRSDFADVARQFLDRARGITQSD